MASKIKSLDGVAIPESYELIKAEYIKELSSFALNLKHKLSGARVLVLSNEDDNKVFSVGFRTPPADSTGVPHIIEHTVLCGSKQFPAKDPFVELIKGSLNTFLNATTYPDKTLYPVASCNDKDFANLMHVYMDAVFYPNIYKYEEIFKQEGWHYELDSPEGEITYNGVVYNEMKGAFSSEESVLERFVMNSLFPDNTYAQESGGDPRNIPELTYEDYLDFHRRYYHPVNSYIYLYGDMDVEERLQWMDQEYLKDFPAIEIDSTIPLQKPFDKMKILEKEYAVAQDADISEKTYYAFGNVMDITLDTTLCKAFELLSYVLAEQPGAPLKQALLDAGIGTDVETDFCDILRQSMFSIVTKNAAPGQRDKFYDIIRQTLEKVVAEGINRKDLEAAINGLEFREREADFGAYPKGLLYGMKLMKTWLYDDNMPYDALQYEEVYNFLREKLSTDYYEKLVQQYLLDNTHAVLVEMIPKPGLALEVEQKTKEQLKAYKDSLTEEEVAKLVQDTKNLKKYQEEPSTKEALESIPMLAREDIRKEVLPVYNDVKEVSGCKVVHHNVATNDIIYLSMRFDVDDLKEYMPQMSFLATLLGYMDTDAFSYREFDTEMNFYTGGIASDVAMYHVKNNSEDYHMHFKVSTKVLRSKIADALRLMKEMMFHSQFTDEKHLQEVVAESRSRLKVRLNSSGHTAAVAHAMACISESHWLNDYSTGMGYYDYLVRLDEHFEEEKEELIAGCKALCQKIFTPERLLVSCTGNEEDYQAFAQAFPEMYQALKNNDSSVSLNMKKYTPNVVKKETAYTTPAEIQYVAIAGDFRKVSDVKHGALRVVRHLLNYDYLWNNVRVKGGAYGVSCNFTRECEGYFTSYRDPNLTSTIETYKKAADFLAGYDASKREITKTIIGTISGMDTPLTPAMKGKRSMSLYLSENSLEELQEQRDQVLSCSVEDIRQAANVVRSIIDTGVLCVIGNEQHVKEEKELFDEVKTLS